MNQRQERIVQIVDQKNSIRFYELKQYFPDIADITLRRDLEALSREQRIIRFHGGVKSAKFQVGTDGMIAYREALHTKEKRAIALKAAELVHPNTTIFIDSGSTCLELCKVFPDVPTFVFTNGVNCAVELCKRKQVQVYMLGGMMNKDTLALSGTTSLSCLDNLNFNLAFLGALGFTEDAFTTGEETSAALKREVIKHSAQTIVLADSSKFGTIETFSFCKPEQVHALITDSQISQEGLGSLRSAEVGLILA